MSVTPVLYTPAELEEILKLTRRTIYELIKSGRLRAFKVGDSWRVMDHELRRFLEADNTDIIYGNPIERERFKEAHPLFFRCVPALHEMVGKVFERSFLDRGPADRVIFYLGELASEDFGEILFLAGNGSGIAALKLLRGLYERTVNAGYISLHTGEVTDFLAFGDFELGKLLILARETGLDPQLSPERAAQVLKAHAAAKARFGKQKSWSKLDLRSMARRVPIPGEQGRKLDILYAPCYLDPTFHAHATTTAIVRRLTYTPDGSRFDGEPTRAWAAHSVRFAHLLLLIGLSIQNRHFGLGLETELQRRHDEAVQAWGEADKKTAAGEGTR